jgi:sugar/nucleoside kinase (ribokinase family)
MAALGSDVRVLTSAAELLDTEFEHASVAVILAPETTMFRHTYDDGRRVQWLLKRAGDIHGRDVPEEWRSSGIWHLAPLTNEVQPNILDVIPADAFVGVTPQGWMREVAPDGKILAVPWHTAEQMIERIDAIVISDEDMPNAMSTARSWAAQGTVVAVTFGTRGSVIVGPDAEVHVPAYPSTGLDETGAGDVYAAALFSRLAIGDAFETAGRFASAVAALKVEGSGPSYVPTRQQVESLLQAG